MDMLLVLAIVFGGAILVLALIGSIILMGLKILKGGFSRSGQKSASEEARMVQEIYHGLDKMDQRIEALETIILDQKEKRRPS